MVVRYLEVVACFSFGIHGEIMKKVTDEALKHMKEIGAADYARQEAWDISQAAQAVAFISTLISNEVDEPDDVQSLANVIRGLIEFINGEIIEMIAAVRGGKSFAVLKEPEEPEKQEEKRIENNFLDLSYVKSLHLGPVIPELAVKFVARDEIRAYSILWGDEKKVDLEKEYFTKNTDFWNEQPKWLTWDHAQDEQFKSDPRIGEILETGDDEWGKWYIARLKRSEAYRKYLDRMIEEKRVGSSSDSAPQYVERVRTGKSIWLKRWPLFAVSLTDNPCEPRMIGSVDYLKSLVDKLPDVQSLLGERNPVDAWRKQQMTFELLKMKYQGEI